jgi:hypothetical protein
MFKSLLNKSWQLVGGEHTGMATQGELEQLVRSILDAETASGYQSIRRVPSTYTWKILDYVSRLESGERDSLFEAFAANGVFLLSPERDAKLHAYQSGHSAYRRFVEAMPKLFGWKYADVRFLRGILGDLRSKNPSPEFANVPPEVIQRAESIRPTKATEIRREIKSVFAQQFKAKAQNRQGGNRLYSCEYQGRLFQVHIDYGGRSAQLRYHLSFDEISAGIRARRLSYEGLLGLGQGEWDFVTADNLSESVLLLVELVEQLVTIPEKLRSHQLT